MNGNKLDLVIHQGETFSRLLTIKDGTGAPVNLTGYQLRGMARKKPLDPLPVFAFTFTLADQMTNAGEVNMELSDTETEGLLLNDVYKYPYDVEMESAGGEVTRIMMGFASVVPQITK